MQEYCYSALGRGCDGVKLLAASRLIVADEPLQQFGVSLILAALALPNLHYLRGPEC